VSQFGTVKPNLPVTALELTNGSQILVGYDDIYVPTNFAETFEDPWIAGISSTSAGNALDWLENADTPEQDLNTAALSQGEAVILAETVFSGPAAGIVLTKRPGTQGGQPLWTTTLTASPFDVIAGIHLKSDGTLLVFGTTYTSFGGPGLGSGDYFLAWVDSQTGALREVVKFGSANTDWAKKLVVTDQAIYAIGEQEMSQDIWRGQAIKLSLAGEVLESRFIELGVNRYLTDAAVLSGGLMISGYYRNLNPEYQGFMQFLSGF
jgi:hypothetical protein